MSITVVLSFCKKMQGIVVIIAIGTAIALAVGLTCLLICCIENIKWRDVENCLIAMDRFYVRMMQFICCIRNHELEPRVIPQREIEITQRYIIPPSTVIINPQNVITIGTECVTNN